MVIGSPSRPRQAHTRFLKANASCHTPNQGIKAATCIACHASAPELLMKPATAFHANLKECTGCHIEHQGCTIRPVRMDHQVVEAIAKRTTGQVATTTTATRLGISIRGSSDPSAQAATQRKAGKSAASCIPARINWNARNATRRRRAII
jgi:Pyruvate/2-oxoacid:ferredoxin oxidoreductase delta subunit